MGRALLLPARVPALIEASSTEPGYSADNVDRDQLGLVWLSAAADAAPALTFDFGGDVAIDTITLFGLAGATASWEWTVHLATEAEGKFTGSYWSGSAEPLLAGSAMPVSGLGKSLWQAPAGAPAAARYARIAFSSLSGAQVEVARAIAGARVQPERNFRYGATLGIRPLGSVDFSVRGVLLRRRGHKLRGIGLTFGHLYRDELEQQIMPLLETVGNDEPLVIVSDPDAHAERQNRMYYGFLTGNLGAIWARPGGFQADFNLVALA
jgi:hypothetical protein